LYFWDGVGGHNQKVELIDPESGAILETRTVNNFATGEYFTWTVRGSIQIRLTAEPGHDALLSGLFLDPFESHSIEVDLTSPSSGLLLPAPTNLWLRAEVKGDPTLVRAVQFIDNGEIIGEDSEWPFEFFWENPWTGLHEVIAKSLTYFDVAAVSEPVQIDIGEPSPYAQFLGENPYNAGDWQGTYGQQGYVIAGHATNLPAFAELELDQDHIYIEADNTYDWRGLQHLNDALRILASYVGMRTINIDLNLRDGLPHLLALYLMETGPDSRTLSLNVTSENGELLDEQVASHLSTGCYYAWAVRGHIRLEVRLEVGGNAILSGLFLGTPLEHWRALKFTPSDLRFPAISGDNADADHDGLPTLLEYLVGSSPKDPTSNAFSIRVEGEQLLIDYVQPNYVWDVRPLLEKSTNLTEWSAYPIETVQRVDQEASQHVRLRANLPPAAGSRSFFRWGAQRQ
jgi:hypothetical protein